MVKVATLSLRLGGQETGGPPGEPDPTADPGHYYLGDEDGERHEHRHLDHDED